MDIRITAGDLDDPRVQLLLCNHAERARAETAQGSAHALDLDGLRLPAIRFWTIWHHTELAGCGALKRLSSTHGELKSMYVDETTRGPGIGRTLLRHLIETARVDGITRLSLETGSRAYFKPAHALYRSQGFVPCAAFADYRPDPNSLFMTLDLTTVAYCPSPVCRRCARVRAGRPA